MTDDPTTTTLDTGDQRGSDGSSGRAGHHVIEWIVGGVCAIGVLAAILVAMNYSGLTLFDEHASQVISDAWNRNATIGVIVALGITVVIVIFVIVLAWATLGHDHTDDDPGLGEPKVPDTT